MVQVKRNTVRFGIASIRIGPDFDMDIRLPGLLTPMFMVSTVKAHLSDLTYSQLEDDLKGEADEGHYEMG